MSQWWRGPIGLFALAAAVVLVSTCSRLPGQAPTAPSLSSPWPEQGGTAGALGVPNAIFRTDPPAGADGTISGEIPLKVVFNLCQSTPSDPDDRLKFTFDFEGDGFDEAQGDFKGACRASHAYRRDARAIVCVSDRRADGDGVVCQTYTIRAFDPPPQPTPTPAPTPTPVNAPSIGSFTASPSTINPGQSSTLSWTTTNATSCSIDNGVGAVACNGNTSVSPAMSTTYTLTATGPGGSATATASVTVNTPVMINSFTATPGTINAGQSSTLSWTTTNATTCSIDNGVGSVSCNGSTSVSPGATTTYTLTATGPGGSVTRNVTVTVNQPPTIGSFTATPGTINGGQSSNLAWTTTNATTCSIDNGVGNVPCNGNTNVSPGATTTYTLTATGPGGTVTANATVNVQECHSINQGVALIPSGCPTGATQFCVPAPIVATSSTHAQAACNACYGAGACSSVTFVCGSGWEGPGQPQNAVFLFSGGAGRTPGDIAGASGNFSFCGGIGRWAP